MKKILLLLSAAIFVSTLFAQAPAGYYDYAQGQTGAQLKTTLFNIIKGHTSVSYTPGIWVAFETTDKKDNGKVWDIYSDVPGGTPAYEWTFGTDQCGTYSGEGSCYNREHSFPKSWFNDASPMYTELFHIYPTDGYVNGQRGNYPYGEVNSASWTSTNGSKVGSNSTSGYSGTVFEPIDEYKGDLARTYFYMATRYEDVIQNWNSEVLDGSKYPVYVEWQLELLISWHENDPVSQKEIDRNNAIYALQHNRNPYIDHPEYVAAVWGSVTTSPIIGNVSTNPAAPEPNVAVVVSASITDNGTLSQVTLKWGTETGVLSNTIPMQANGSLYTATIPAQAAGTRVYYQITAVDNDQETGVSSEYSYYLSAFDGTIQLPINEDFESGDMGIFTAVNVTGTSQYWASYSYSGNLMAKMSGYDYGAVPNEDWLLTPLIDFNSYTSETMSFRTAMNYPDDASTTFQAMYSTNYSGSGDPNAANWTDLSSQANWSTGGYVFVESGTIDLSTIVGDAVTIAFKYANTSTAAESWELDDVIISGTPVNTGLYELGLQKVSIYPNPTTSWVQLNGELANDTRILIFNYLGQLQLEENLKNTSNHQVYVGSLKAGIYILQLDSKELGTQNIRLIIQ
ncbi:MAG: endonuclease [Bacteroidales bacterium]|nr:endonuclease [Bacteroidales bacterium]